MRRANDASVIVGPVCGNLDEEERSMGRNAVVLFFVTHNVGGVI